MTGLTIRVELRGGGTGFPIRVELMSWDRVSNKSRTKERDIGFPIRVELRKGGIGFPIRVELKRVVQGYQ